MTHSRRRWLFPTILSACAIATASSAFAASHAGDAATLEADKGPAASADADRILAGNRAISGAIARDADAKDIGEALTPVTKSTNSDAALNAAIVIARLQTISTDKYLEEMLSNPDPAIRYWGAKGLGDLLPALKDLPTAAKRAQDKLNAAYKDEKEPIVRRTLQRALGLPVVPPASSAPGS